MKRMQIYHTFIIAVALILMALPFGAKCYYASAAGPDVIDFNAVETMSFFDARLFEFQNPIPFILGILTVALTVLTVLRSVLDLKSLHIVCLVGSGLGLLLAVLPLLLYGVEYFSTVSMTVAFLMLCATILDVCIFRNVRLLDD